jgi:hypothetical protein
LDPELVTEAFLRWLVGAEIPEFSIEVLVLVFVLVTVRGLDAFRRFYELTFGVFLKSIFLFIIPLKINFTFADCALVWIGIRIRIGS